MKKTLKTPSLIAEIGLNFSGSLKRAIELSELSINSGSDYIKYQFFTAENLINEKYYKQVLNIETDKLINTLNSLQLSNDEYYKLFCFNEEKSYFWGSSFFSVDDAKIFFEKRNFHKFNCFSFIKIASGEITDIPLLKYLGEINKELNLPVIISTGISTDSEIKKAISYFKKNSDVYLLHCIVEYPVQTKYLNLNRIRNLKNRFKVESGFSDHSISIIPSILSLFFGAKVIEKHFTDSRINQEADNPISSEPNEFLQIKDAINSLSSFIGDGKLKISDKEYKELTYARKGIYAAKHLTKDTIISYEDIASKRPNLGINDAKIIEKFIGKKINKDIEKDEPLKISDFY